MATRRTDWAARCFQTAMIIFVVAGHSISAGFNGPFDLFPVASFHVAGFSFISGYLYNTDHDAHPLSYIKHKFIKLVIPTFGIYLIYGLFTSLLNAQLGFRYRGSAAPSAVYGAAVFAVGQFDLV